MKPQLVSLLVGAFLSFFAYERTDGFTVAKVAVSVPFNPTYETPLPKETASILCQSYTYLAKGRQCFVFQSADQKYVLKLFNHNRFDFPIQKAKRLGRKEATFFSYKLAYDFLFEDCGLVAVHLVPSEKLPPVELHDRTGGVHLLDLTSLPFILQKKADLYFDHLPSLPLASAISEIVSFVDRRLALGILDQDVDLSINLGWLDGKPLLIDPGRLELGMRAGELKRETRRLEKWISHHHPEALEIYQKEIIMRENVETAGESPL
jgi:hypothetical protein